MKRTLQIANIIALIVTVVVNYLSNTGIFNNSTMASVSAQYQNFFTPSGYAFSIWGVIYLLLTAFVIYQTRGVSGYREAPAVVEKIGWLFVISCAANSAWVLAWLYDFTGLSVFIMVGLLASLWLIIVHTRMGTDVIPIKKNRLRWYEGDLRARYSQASGRPIMRCSFSVLTGQRPANGACKAGALHRRIRAFLFQLHQSRIEFPEFRSSK
ncbi:TspO/MBR family protein [Dyadobacter sp.]|uniref:TspO/MBR family protein n=1 Tax=Dyadobacter sp. TaxID=1914288 RepID=UPI0025BCC145|nr:TspO/MBR family protein [Dyadobacter sp.]